MYLTSVFVSAHQWSLNFLAHGPMSERAFSISHGLKYNDKRIVVAEMVVVECKKKGSINITD